MSNYVRFIGTQDHSYNSYLILDQVIVIMDAVGAKEADAWLLRLERELDGRSPDYLVISHMEPGYARAVELLTGIYPNMKLAGNAQNLAKLLVFSSEEFHEEDRRVEIGPGEELCIGETILNFYTIPEWETELLPEQDSLPTLSYLTPENVLFSSDVPEEQVEKFLQRFTRIKGDMIYPLIGSVRRRI